MCLQDYMIGKSKYQGKTILVNQNVDFHVFDANNMRVGIVISISGQIGIDIAIANVAFFPQLKVRFGAQLAGNPQLITNIFSTPCYMGIEDYGEAITGPINVFFDDLSSASTCVMTEILSKVPFPMATPEDLVKWRQS